MFKNEFQGGPFLEILTIQGKESQSRYQHHGLVRKDFDKDVKSYVLSLEGDTAQSKICIPKNEKQSLHIIQRFLVLQLLVPLGAAFSLEVVVLDTTGQKRRLLFSTSHKEICVTSFHVKIPLLLRSRGVWGNLCLDIISFVEETFRSCTYKAIERITITANCRLRKIISMKHRIPESSFQDYGGDLIYNEDDICDVETASRLLQLNVAGEGKQAINQVCNIKSLLHSDIRLRQSSGSSAKLILKEPSDSVNTHIAFGTRSLVPRSPHKAAHTAERTCSASSSSGTSIGSIKGEEKSNEADCAPQIEALRLPFQPRPPKQSSGYRKRRPNPRLRACDSPILSKKETSKGATDTSEGSAKEFSEVKSPVSLEAHENGARDSDLDVNNNSCDQMNYYTSALTVEDRNQSEESDNSTKPSDTNRSNGLSKKESVGHLSAEGDGLVMGNSADLEDYFRIMREEEEQLSNLASGDARAESRENSASQRLSNDHTFLYSSHPKRPIKSQRLCSSSDGSVFGADNNNNNQLQKPPDVVVTGSSSSLCDTQGSAKSGGFPSLESDFIRQSSDSEDEPQPGNCQRIGTNQRLSPVPPPARSPSLKGGNRSGRASAKGNMEVAPTSKYDDENERYQSGQSDSMSWIYDSDTSQRLSVSGSIQEGPDLRDESGYHEETFVNMKNRRNNEKDEVPEGLGRFSAMLGDEVALGADSDDCLTDDSDETSFSVWQSPPSQIRNYRYQDEMHGIGMTLDLAATLPMTPFTEELEKTMPVLTSETKDQVFLNGKAPVSSSSTSADGQGEANVLDLMYDPDLNCYYDPKTHHYYELA